jgi:hypothetical protein
MADIGHWGMNEATISRRRRRRRGFCMLLRRGAGRCR